MEQANVIFAINYNSEPPKITLIPKPGGQSWL